MLSISLVFRIPKTGGDASVQQGTTRQCWLNCGSTLQWNGHNFIGLDGDFTMTTHGLTSCSFWLNLTLPVYHIRLIVPILFPVTSTYSHHQRQSSLAFDLRPLKQCWKKVRRLSRTWQRMACVMCSRNGSNAVRSAFNWWGGYFEKDHVNIKLEQ